MNIYGCFDLMLGIYYAKLLRYSSSINIQLPAICVGGCVWENRSSHVFSDDVV